ncbi:hypothetical protein B296_00028250 [Ensete ventricosum]|uniref:Uncharacterized protein n=1 Tax=Ensete ventricosum TaxID=4639 RepID=A0A426Y154_ENSVE|nr:hypothetical protein B296_00028250 [Ensete ventricosum]
MSTSDESYKAIWARKATMCSTGSTLPLYDSKGGSLKLVGIGLSCISRVKGKPPFELSADFSEATRELPTGFLAGGPALQDRVELVPCVPESRLGLYVTVGAPTNRSARGSCTRTLGERLVLGRVPSMLKLGIRLDIRKGQSFKLLSIPLISSCLRVFIPMKAKVVVPGRYRCYNSWRCRVQSFAGSLGPLTASQAFKCALRCTPFTVLGAGRPIKFPDCPC